MWRAYLSVLNIFLALYVLISFLATMIVPFPLCWYWALFCLSHSLCLSMVKSAWIRMGLLSLLIPDSKNTPISQLSIHWLSTLSLCLLAFLLGNPLALTARILRKFYLSWLSRLSIFSYEASSVFLTPSVPLTTQVSRVSYCLCSIRSIPPASLILTLIWSWCSIICLFLRVPLTSTIRSLVFMYLDIQSPAWYSSQLN